MIRSLPFNLLAIGLLIGVLSSCSRKTGVIVRNSSPLSLSNVQVTGEAFAIPIGDLPAGARRIVPLDLPAGEYGHVGISFLAANRIHSSRHTTYFEPRGYQLTITVRPDFSSWATVTISD